MKKKYFIFGANSAVAKNFIRMIKGNSNIICFTSKNIKKKIIKNIKYFKTNYSTNSVNKILKREIDNKNKNIFLFFNAISEHKAFYKLDEKELTKIINVNYRLPILLTKIIIKNFYLKKLILIYFSSSRALNIDKGIALYGSTKIGLESFVKSMALEYGNLGLNFRVVSLGLIEGGLEKTISEKLKSSILKRSSIAKKIKIEEIHKIVEFIVRDTTGNGSTIKCDNGYY